ncbi:MAG: hypothetical protein WDW38_006201 [Sanguina aurantia]
MGGGGAFNVAAGQLTDDSELAISLLRGLVGVRPQDGFPAEAVARKYNTWMDADYPFDVGGTCRAAFSNASCAADMCNNALANQAEYVARWNSGAAANGGLMRIAPLAIWAHARTTNAELIALAKQDALLSHPSEVCQDANAVYCVAIAALLKSGRAGGSSTQERAATAIRAVDSVIGVMDEVIQRWYRDSSTLTLGEIVVTHLIGHLKHAFLLAFYFLRRGTAYDVAIVETCRKLGDSDTNAAIVGALLGALHGSSGIPQHMSRPVLAFDCAAHNPQLTGRGHRRPATYRTKDAMALLPSLLGVEQML